MTAVGFVGIHLSHSALIAKLQEMIVQLCGEDVRIVFICIVFSNGCNHKQTTSTVQCVVKNGFLKSEHIP